MFDLCNINKYLIEAIGMFKTMEVHRKDPYSEYKRCIICHSTDESGHYENCQLISFLRLMAIMEEKIKNEG